MRRTFQRIFSFIILISFTINSVFAGNIDATNKWAWGSHMGWINFGSSTGNVTVATADVTGYAWSNLYGWINLSPSMSGLDNTCAGDISGSAWSGMFGYIDFSGAVIDGNGYFQGKATTPSNGNIVFQGTHFSLQTGWKPTCTAPVSLAITSPSTGSTLSDSTPTITGNGATPGSTIIVTGPGGQTCNALADVSGNWSCDISPSLSDGVGLLSATEILSNGNAFPSVNVSVTIDGIAPISPTITDVNGDTTPVYLTNDTTPSFTGTGEIGSTITLKTSTGILLGTGLVDGSGNWNIISSLILPEGAQQIDATSTDSGGNTSLPLAISLMIDSIAPTSPTIANPTSGIITNDNTPTINGTGEPNSIFVIKDGSGSVIGTGIVDGSGNYTFTPLSGLPDGSLTLSVTTIDSAGNESLATTRTFTIDTNAPTPLTITSPINASTTNDTTPTLLGTGEPNTTFEVRDSGGTIMGTGLVDGSGNYSFTPTTPLPEGTNTYSVTLIDAALNTTGPVTSTFTIDTTLPSAPIISSVGGDTTISYTTNITTPTIIGTGEVGAIVSLYSSTGVILGTGMVQPSGTWSIVPSSPLSEGTNNLSVSQTDPSGNISPSSSFDVIVDSLAPVAPTIVSAGGDTSNPYLTNDATPTIVGNGIPGDTITIRDTLGNVVGTAVVDGSGNWTLDISPSLPDGSQLLKATATDTFGNISPITSFSVTIDTTAPLIPVVSSIGGDTTSPYTTNDTTPQFIGTGEIGSTITIKSSTGVILGTGIVDVVGNWSITPSSALPLGTHSVQITSTDSIGNTSSPVASTFTIDAAVVNPPVITSVGGDTNSPYTTTDATPMIIGTGTPGDTITIKNASGSTIGIGTVASDGTWSIITDALPDGTQTLSLTETNTLGTVSTPITLSLTIDTTTPSSSSSSSSSSGGGNGGGWAGGGNKSTLPINTVSTDVTNKTPVTIDHPEVVIPQGNPDTDIPKTQMIDGKERSYILKNDFKSCPIIDNLNNDMFKPEYLTKFTDLKESKFVDDIIQMEKVGIVDGDSETLFQPTRTITRAEFLKILIKSHCYEYKDEITKNTQFTDITKDTWQAKVAEKGLKLGIINGDIDKLTGKKVFRPNDVITKAEAIKMLMNIGLLQIGEPFLTTYTDVGNTWYEKYVSNGEYLGVLNSKNEKYIYAADSLTLRDDMVHMTMKLVKLYR